MNILITLILAAVLSVTSAIGVYRYGSLDLLEGTPKTQTLGSTITTINGTDRLTDSRTTINDNFANLNATKIENSTTSVASITTLPNLSSIGTILTGVWNATPITVPYGGTGSTTLSSNQLLIGKGTSQVGVVPGWGTTGQLLVSNGASNAPTWQSPSVDTTISYFWTAYHHFTSLGADIASTTNATSTNLTVTGNLIYSGSLAPGGLSLTASTSVWIGSGTWTKPTGAKVVFIEGWGAGAGSAGIANNQWSGGGGGGGYFYRWMNASDISATVSISAGSGGTAGASGGGNGGNGGNSTFGSYLTAVGATACSGGCYGTGDISGGNGASSGKGSTWAGGTSGPPGIGVSYGGGGGGHSTNIGGGDIGGSSTYGGGGGGGSGQAGGTSDFEGGAGGAGATSGVGTAGSAPGGGGGGSASNVIGSLPGAAGARGQIRVTTFF